MRKLTYLIASTIDGFIAGPEGADPTGPDGFFRLEGDHMEALFRDYPETIPGHLHEMLGIRSENKVFDTVLMGRRTYDIGVPAGITNPYPQLRTYVFSQSMASSPDPAVELVTGDPVAKVKELKQQDGKGIWLCGGAELAGVLRPKIDELIVKLHPVVVGSGVPLFAGGFDPQQFDLAASQIYRSGVAMLTYTRRLA